MRIFVISLWGRVISHASLRTGRGCRNSEERATRSSFTTGTDLMLFSEHPSCINSCAHIRSPEISSRVTNASDTWSVKVFPSEDVGDQNPAVARCEHPHYAQRVGVRGYRPAAPLPGERTDEPLQAAHWPSTVETPPPRPLTIASPQSDGPSTRPELAPPPAEPASESLLAGRPSGPKCPLSRVAILRRAKAGDSMRRGRTACTELI